MGSAFGEIYSSVKMLFPAMLVLATLGAGCVLWWRLVSAPILVAKPLWPWIAGGAAVLVLVALVTRRRRG